MLLVEKTGAVAVVTLNRPAAMNALSKALRAALGQALAELEADAGVRAIVLTGAGERAFSAGLDLKELGADPAVVQEVSSQDPALNPIAAVLACRKPVVGAINGVAITGGFELALACDVLICSRSARFADTHARVGILPTWGLSQRLSRLIGPYRARELSLTGDFLDAETACAWGLVNRLVEPAELLPAAMRLAEAMADVDPATLVTYKALIGDGYALAFEDALALEADRSTAHNLGVTPQMVEARRAAVLARGRSQ